MTPDEVRAIVREELAPIYEFASETLTEATKFITDTVNGIFPTSE